MKRLFAFLLAGAMVFNTTGCSNTPAYENTEQTAEIIDAEPTEVHTEELSNAQKFWNKDWYGWWHIKNTTGKWADQNNHWWDCAAKIEFDSENNGSIVLWDEGGSKQVPLAEVQLSLTQAIRGSLGVIRSVQGSFMNQSIEKDEWLVVPNQYDYEDLIIINGEYTSEDGSFDYAIHLRPWGLMWDDMAVLERPNAYTGWYKPLIQSGAQMPDTIADGKRVDTKKTRAELFPIFEEIDAQRTAVKASSVAGVQSYSEHWFGDSLRIQGDLSDARELAYTLTVSDATVFVQGEPTGYDKSELIEWGKNPGLNVDVLHDLGYTGKGAVIAYVDQPISSHKEYNNANVHYINNTASNDSMHGPTVLSMLVGENIGTAPEAEVYYYAHASWKADQTTHAQCLYQIIEQNEKLEEDQKITMVGFSDQIDPTELNANEFHKAVAACKEAGIKVFFCGDYSGGSFIPLSDKNNPDNIVPENWGTSAGLVVPTSGRTGATNQDNGKYIYWSSGGLSWAMPYVLGLYAIAGEIDPSLSQVELYTLLSETAKTNGNGLKVIDPVGFIVKVLRGVGKNAEAQELLDEVEARTQYMYAVVNSDSLTTEDEAAIDAYLKEITDAKVIKVDARNFDSASDLYVALKKDMEYRSGTVVGIQLFGDSDSIPAFNIHYKVQMSSDIDNGGKMLTDLFYSNFDNSIDDIGSGYSVMDHFADAWDVNLVPQWPVARLPLKSGEFADFLSKYADFKDQTELEQQDIVNLSNPIFANSRHNDDMGKFLNRAKSEFGILNVPYRLYGNLDGDYPVSTAVLGNFTSENLELENEKGIMELIINSHGQMTNIDRCIFQNGEEVRESLINTGTINTVLDDNYYYLDTWTCLNGTDMKNNLTTTALNGKCVGMFSATAIISNNGVNNSANLSAMQQSNFYWFYYNYLKALNQGESRSQAFYIAQKAYAEALLADSVNGIRQGEGNYQFNLYNLLAYHNFGLIELEYCSGKKAIQQVVQPIGNSGTVAATQPVAPQIKKSNGVQYYAKDSMVSGTVTLYGVSVKETKNGTYQISIDCDTPKGMKTTCFNPPDGDVFKIHGSKTKGGRQTYTFELTKSQLQRAEKVNCNFSFNDKDRFMILIDPSSVQGIE